MTKIDMTRAICGWDGDQLMVSDDVGVTLRSVCLNSLGGAGKKNEEFKEKIKRFELGMRIQREDVLDLSAKEISTLQDLINEAYPSALVTIQAHRMLEPGQEDDKG